jgi:hypothetical protein
MLAILGYWWVPVVIAVYAVQAYFSKHLNEPGSSYKWFWYLWLMSIIPLWAVVAKYSKSLLADATIYDVLMYASFWVALAAIGGAVKFNMYQWGGLILAAGGFFVMRFCGSTS